MIVLFPVGLGPFWVQISAPIVLTAVWYIDCSPIGSSPRLSTMAGSCGEMGLHWEKSAFIYQNNRVCSRWLFRLRDSSAYHIQMILLFDQPYCLFHLVFFYFAINIRIFFFTYGLLALLPSRSYLPWKAIQCVCVLHRRREQAKYFRFFTLYLWILQCTGLQFENGRAR